MTLIIIISFSKLFAQNPDSLKKSNAPNVYLDFNSNELSYIKDHITFVNYTHERRAADLHILSTNSTTGSGGKMIVLIFYGQNKFEGKNDTIYFSIKPSTADEIVKEKLVKIIKLGIMKYITDYQMFDDFNIEYTGKNDNQVSEKEDPWNYWVFKINLYGWYNGESSYQNYRFHTKLSASRVTDKYKYSFNLSNGYNESHYIYGDDEIIGITRRYSFYHEMVKSLSDHWSIGYNTNVNSSLYTNLNYSFQVNPAIEYDVYPYSKSTIKQFRIMYTIGPKYNNYIDTTVFDKKKELLYEHTLLVGFQTNQKWGYININMYSGTYLHDFSLNYMTFYSDLSLNLFKGLSLNLDGSLSFIHNQINISKNEVSLENVLIQTIQLPTTFSYYASVGFSYTFGSIYNNVVNPRFDF